MGSKLSHRIIPPLVALALAVTPAAASAVGKDYSKNGATGDYAPALVHKNYALNGATGDYAPATVSSQQPSVRIVRVSDNSGFAWTDAGVGAATVLLAMLFGGLAIRQIHRRRIAAPNPARPSAV
jgi:hypothetical protein